MNEVYVDSKQDTGDSCILNTLVGSQDKVLYNGKLWWRESLTNPHFNSFEEINFDELLDIAKYLQ